MNSFISFRDHDARVIQYEGKFYRLIYEQYAKEYQHFMQSGLYHELLKNNMIIEHEEIPNFRNDEKLHKTLAPKQIHFISYPYEWTASQWSKVVEQYLNINLIALNYGMILKDATPYNFFFQGNTPILLDTSSFIFYEDKQPWIAYKQFCEECFGPLALIHYKGPEWIKLNLQKSALQLPFISKHLPTRSRFNFSTYIHIHLHSKFYDASSKSAGEPKGLTKEKLILLQKSLLSTINDWRNKKKNTSRWANYYEADLESTTYLEAKESIIRSWFEQTKPSTVLDLGANTGYFSKMATEYAKEVIALESDHEAAEKITSLNIENLNSVFGDITEPSPALGFMNAETSNLLKRCKSELVMGLALVHHLCITKRLSFAHVAELFAELTSKYAIIEFVPEDDQKVLLLKKNSPKNYNEYTEEKFKQGFTIAFQLVETQQISGSNRKLFLFEKI